MISGVTLNMTNRFHFVADCNNADYLPNSWPIFYCCQMQSYYIVYGRWNFILLPIAIIFPIGDLSFPVAKCTPTIWPMDYTFVANCNYADHLHNWLALNCTVLRDWQSVFCCHHSLFVCVHVHARMHV